MNRSDETLFDPRIADWLEDDPSSAPDRALDVVLAAFPLIKQRRASRVSWRYPDMSSFSKLLALAAALVLVAVGGVYFLGPRPNDSVGGPSSTASPPPTSTPSPSPTAKLTRSPAASATSNPLLDLSRWSPYTSSQYDLVMLYPEDWTVEPAARAWDLDSDASDWLSPAMDDFTPPTGDVRVSVWSAQLEPGTIVDETPQEVEAWILEYCEKAGGGDGCAGLLDHTIPLCVEFRDCHPGVLVARPGRDTQAFFTGGIYAGQMVVVSIWRDTADPSLAPYGGGVAFMDAFLQPLCVFREDAREEPPPACPNTSD